MNEFFKIIKNIGLLTLTVGFLGILGAVINAYVPWIWLTDFFVIIRHCLTMVDFFWDTTTTIALMSISLTIVGALWTYRGVMVVVQWFKD